MLISQAACTRLNMGKDRPLKEVNSGILDLFSLIKIHFCLYLERIVILFLAIKRQSNYTKFCSEFCGFLIDCQ